jgi:hypothetical protein
VSVAIFAPGWLMETLEPETTTVVPVTGSVEVDESSTVVKKMEEDCCLIDFDRFQHKFSVRSDLFWSLVWSTWDSEAILAFEKHGNLCYAIWMLHFHIY